NNIWEEIEPEIYVRQEVMDWPEIRNGYAANVLNSAKQSGNGWALGTAEYGNSYGLVNFRYKELDLELQTGWSHVGKQVLTPPSERLAGIRFTLEPGAQLVVTELGRYRVDGATP